MFSVEIKNDAVTGLLTRLGAQMSDMTQVFEQLGEYLVKSTKDRFPTGQAPDGTRWAPKSPTTLRMQGARKSNHYDARPLFGPSGALHQQIFHEASPSQLEVGSNLIYAAVQQFGARKGQFGSMANGSPIPWGDIPARPIFGISAEDEAAIRTILTEFLTGFATAQ